MKEPKRPPGASGRASTKGRQAAALPITLLFIIFLACKVGPDYVRPSLPVPPAYKSPTAQVTGNPQIGREWWRLFKDPDLDRLMEEALEANTDLKAAMARVLEARENVAAVKSQFYPVLTLNPAVTRSRFNAASRGSSAAAGGLAGGTGATPTPRPNPTPPPTPGGTPTPTPTPAAGAAARTAAGARTGVVRSNFFQMPFDLSYEVDIWGRVRRAVEAARAQERVSQFDQEVVRQTLLADLAQDYFNLRSLEEQSSITLSNVGLYREQIELTELQFKAGLASELNIFQTRALMDAVLAQEIDLRRQRADLEHAMAILLGRPPAQFSLPTRVQPPNPPVIPAGVPTELLRRRPDVAESEQNLVAATAQIGVAKANLFPTLRLSATGGLEGATTAQLTEWDNHFWTIGANVAAPLFEGGLLRANLRQARARYQELEATYRGAMLSALRDVEDALTDLSMRAQAFEAQEKAVDAARGYLELAQVQYRTGIISYLQVIDADRTLLSTEIARAQIRYERMISTVLLIKALGGGWDSHSSGPAQAVH